MNQEKSILELLIIVRNYLEGITIIKGNHLYPLGGLCHIIFNLQGNIDKEMPNRNNKYLISDLEHYILHTYIHKHRPKRGMFYDSEYKRTAFFWKPGLVEPRLNWIDYRISIEQKRVKT